MDNRRVELLDQAFELLRTPYVLDLLAALHDGRFCRDDYADTAALDRAVDYLRRIGAATTGPQPMPGQRPPVWLTPRGERLVADLYAIEQHLVQRAGSASRSDVA